ncbi:MAG TPA: Rid family hydrolase [Chthonomonadales bacterium]|nr:Rid family hydrolase [Chthonomonadales bacterium]
MMAGEAARGALSLRTPLTDEEIAELQLLGMLGADGERAPAPTGLSRERVERKTIEAHDVLNEAYTYARPSSFSRGLRVPVGPVTLLLISGTASIDEAGRSVHIGDFRAQCWRTYRNITRLLQSEGATWQDVVRCTCYLRDIERDYRDFNEVRTAFFDWLALDPLPASTGIQARLCREELLVEIESMAVLPAGR